MSEKRKLVKGDPERFKKFWPSGRPQMPVGYNAPLDTRPTIQIIRERDEADAAAGRTW